MKYALAHETRIGTRRINQDRIGHWATSECVLMAVADGLGGHPHGEVAAELAVGVLGAAFVREAQPRLGDPGDFFNRAIANGHEAILRDATRRGLIDTPRTVLVVCAMQEGQAYWTHVGDSRLYLIRDGRIVHRTRDHTVVQELVDTGRIREEASTTHPERNRLLQCLGGYSKPQPAPLMREPLFEHDIVLLCSDGFWGPLTQRQLLHSLMTRPLDQAIPELVELAQHRAGHDCDNISVLAMRWGEQPAASRPVAVQERTLVQDFTATEPDYRRVSDEDIERAIAELKNALRKSSNS
ncbi:MAG TPA: protein phosphatase 2C domain-containing protein [Burkholderiales bacterium]|nr:protein phosphatase 2C domain-containing protein [Burkholderiales bacterium]